MPSARRVNWAKFRVTAVTLVALLILVTLFYLLTGGSLFKQSAQIYLYTADATGLDKGSSVEVNGIPVGKVDSVLLSGSRDPNRVVRVTITVEISRLASIPVDSQAEIGSESLAGDKFVDVTSGSSPNHIPPGGELHQKPASGLMRSLDIPQLVAQLRNMDTILSQMEDPNTPIGQFVQGDLMYNNLVKRFGDIERAARAAVNSATTVGNALYTEDYYRQIHDPLVALDHSLMTLQSSALLRDTAQYESMRAQFVSLRKTVEDLHAGVWMQSDEMYNSWNRTVTSMILSVDQMNANPLFNTTEVYDSLNGTVRQTRDMLKDFRENPRKYLRLKVF